MKKYLIGNDKNIENTKVNGFYFSYFITSSITLPTEPLGICI